MHPVLRAAIWDAMGPKERYSSPATDEGHRRRALLAVMAAQQVLSIWRRSWPDDSTADEALAAASQVISGEEQPTESSWKLLEDLWLRIDNLAGSNFPAAMAGLSAVTAYRTALEDEEFEPDSAGELGKWVTDVGDQEAASLASLAAAGGSFANPQSSRAERLRFWRWWLDEAVPAAYREGTLE